jgi:hypothetical protein
MQEVALMGERVREAFCLPRSFAILCHVTRVDTGRFEAINSKGRLVRFLWTPGQLEEGYKCSPGAPLKIVRGCAAWPACQPIYQTTS